MYLTDYHMHSAYSFDCESSLRDICEAAISRGLSEIAITDHMDIFSNRPYGDILNCDLLYKDLEKYKEEYRGRLRILAGIELGQPQANPMQAAEFMKDYGDRLDFVIGSIHNMEGDIDAYDYDYKKVDYHRIFEMFLDWTYELALRYDYDVLGHITYPSRYIYNQINVRVDFDTYREQYTNILKTVIARGRGIELNMSGFARGSGDSMPDIKLLKLYRSLGGEIITVGSDAHIPEHVGLVSAKGYELLTEAGFKYVTVFEGRNAKFLPV